MVGEKKTPNLNYYPSSYLFPKKPGLLWRLSSKITFFGVGIFSKLLLNFFNKSKVHNMQYLMEAGILREKTKGLITVTNHQSCFDDPGIWGSILTSSQFLNDKFLRWSLAAHDICFKNWFSAHFCALGKVAPVVRGAGVYQETMDFLLQKIKNGEWVNIFPEGKVNSKYEYIRFKWGVGRLVVESLKVPVVIPIYHVGMDSVLPNPKPGEKQSRILRPGNFVTIYIGEPIYLNDLMEELRSKQTSLEDMRKIVTDIIQFEMIKIGMKAHKLHSENKKRHFNILS